MKTHHLIEAFLFDSSGRKPGAEEFEAKYAANCPGKTTSYLFEDEKSAETAMTLLRKHGIDFERGYLFEVLNVGMHPAFYFGRVSIDGLLREDSVNEKKMGTNDIATDFHSVRVIVSSRMRALLEERAQDVNWITLAGKNKSWSELDVKTVLPDPIFLPHAIELGDSEEPDGTYWVRSDGREVISDANVAVLRKAGIAVSDTFRVHDRSRRWRPNLLIAGTVLQSILDRGYNGLLVPHVPLLLYGDPSVAYLTKG